MGKLVTFDYTKDNGETSERLGYIVASPTENYAILDFSDFDPEKAEDLISEYEVIHSMLKAFYKKAPFKNFKAKGITNMYDF